MSFGSSIGDVLLLTQLAWRTVQNCKKACGEHEGLTIEASRLHTLLQRLERELQNPDGLVNRDTGDAKEELRNIIQGCEKNLGVLNLVLDKYNALSETERSGRKVWQRIRFGNGELAGMADTRSKITFCISAISLFLNMLNVGSAGRVEREMSQAGGDLRDIRIAVNGIAASLMTGDREDSILTAYSNDEKAVWKEFRRELVADGFTSSTIRRHKHVIMAYVKELGSRGLFDEVESEGDDDLKSRTSHTVSDREAMRAGKRLNESSPVRPDGKPADESGPEEESAERQSRPGSAPKETQSHIPKPTLQHPKRRPAMEDPTIYDTEQATYSHTPEIKHILNKLEAIELKLHKELVPRCVDIIDKPLAAGKARITESVRLMDGIIHQVLLELDFIDQQEHAETKVLSKDLAWQAQVWRKELHRVMTNNVLEASDKDSIMSYAAGTLGNVPDQGSDTWPIRRDLVGESPTKMSTDYFQRPPMADNEHGTYKKYAAWLTFAEDYIRNTEAQGEYICKCREYVRKAKEVRRLNNHNQGIDTTRKDMELLRLSRVANKRPILA